MMMHGIAFKGNQHNEDTDAPVVIIGSPSPSSGVAGTVVIDWAITYTGTVTSSDITGKIYTSAAAEGVFTLINPTSATPTVRFTSSVGNGGSAVFLMLANAAYNGSEGSAQTAWGPSASTTATPPIVIHGVMYPEEGDEGDAIIDWGISYSSWADTYSLVTSEITGNYTGGLHVVQGTWSVINGTTSTPTVRFTSTTGYGTVGFDVLAGACQSAGVNNAPSSPSATADIEEDEGK